MSQQTFLQRQLSLSGGEKAGFRHFHAYNLEAMSIFYTVYDDINVNVKRQFKVSTPHRKHWLTPVCVYCRSVFGTTLSSTPTLFDILTDCVMTS